MTEKPADQSPEGAADAPVDVQIDLLEARLLERLEESARSGRIVRRSQRTPVGLGFVPARHDVLERRDEQPGDRQHEEDERQIDRIPHPAAPPGGEGGEPEGRQCDERGPADSLDDVTAAHVAELVRDHGVLLAAREAAVEQRAPEDHRGRRPEAGHERVRLVGPARDVLDADRRARDVLDAREPTAVGGEPRVIQLVRRGREQPAGDEREERHDRDDDGRCDEPPAPEAARQPDEEHDRRERRGRRREQRPLAAQPAENVERPEPPVVVPPQRREVERERDEPQHGEQHDPGDHRAPDAPEPDRADAPRPHAREDDERGKRRGDPGHPQRLDAARVARSAFEGTLREVAVDVEPRQVEGRDARPREQQCTGTPHSCSDG